MMHTFILLQVTWLEVVVSSGIRICMSRIWCNCTNCKLLLLYDLSSSCLFSGLKGKQAPWESPPLFSTSHKQRNDYLIMIPFWCCTGLLFSVLFLVLQHTYVLLLRILWHNYNSLFSNHFSPKYEKVNLDLAELWHFFSISLMYVSGTL